MKTLYYCRLSYFYASRKEFDRNCCRSYLSSFLITSSIIFYSYKGFPIFTTSSSSSSSALSADDWKLTLIILFLITNFLFVNSFKHERAQRKFFLDINHINLRHMSTLAVPGKIFVLCAITCECNLTKPYLYLGTAKVDLCQIWILSFFTQLYTLLLLISC